MEELRRAFADRYGVKEPTHIVSVPGRINLIGDHTDYNSLPVFPMALGQCVHILYRARENPLVRLVNIDPQFGPLEFALSLAVNPDPPGGWGNYVKAAGQELALQFPKLNGLEGVVESTIPIAAGLSSSSALVVAAAIALIQVNNLSLDRTDLMEMLARAEHYVGTRGGGMDQAICVGAESGTAARIDFDPLRFAPTLVPPRWRFVVANSLVRAEKSGEARDAYNLRTRECNEALQIVAAILGLEKEISSYATLLSKVEVEKILTAADQALSDTLARRFRHVVTEGVRVTQAEHAMQVGDHETFGYLMSESHRSLRDDFEVSCPELNELTEIATDAGAAGARLTGAGFGGCVIALCTDSSVGGVLESLRDNYYSRRKVEHDLIEALFVAEPGGGAEVVEL